MSAAVKLALLVTTQSTSLAVIPTMRCGAQVCGDSSRLSALHGALLSATKRRSLRALSDEELFVDAGSEIAQRILGCGPELNCVCSASAALPVELILVLIANVEVEPAFVGLRLIDRIECRIVGQTAIELPRGAELSQEVERMAKAVLEKAGFIRWGHVRFDLDPADAIVVADAGMSAELGDGRRFNTKPGQHTVTAQRAGYEPQTITFSLKPDEEQSIQVRLEAEATVFESPWFWAAIGLVAAGALTTSVVWLNRREVVCVPAPGMSCEL